MQRIVLISGAGSGIGRATAIVFAEAGDHVVAIDVLEAEGEAVVSKIRERKGSAEFHRLDVTQTKELTALIDLLGPIDIAIANAGIARRRRFSDLDEAAWDEVLDVNHKSAAQLLRASVNGMLRAGRGGSLLAISSVSARLGWSEHVHYNASKAGLEGLIRGIAAEFGPFDIRANAILPGVIRTAQSLSVEHSLGEAGLEAIKDRIPLRRVGTPENVADVAYFLCSPGAQYITGQSIVVDGGLTTSSY
jgi:3-oxoacyl-[acyl-carrier protein] reductase